jgi:hypothetical protein
VETAAKKLGVDPKGLILPNVPGFRGLADQIQLYGNRYGVKEFTQSASPIIFIDSQGLVADAQNQNT